MTRFSFRFKRLTLAVTGMVVACVLGLPVTASAQDKVRVGVFPVSSSLPLFVAQDRGFFKEQNIEVEVSRLIGGPPNIAALISDQIDAAAVVVTIEGMNANLKKPGVAMYISLNTQNETNRMEQFVVRSGLEIKSLADLKGKKIMSAPGPANVSMARAALAAAGLKDGEYQLDQLDMGQHNNAMMARTFDAGYTLEPNATVMNQSGIAKTFQAGVIARTVFKDANANAWAGGGVISSNFMKNKPDVARRYAAAWAKAIDFINEKPAEARKSLLKNTFTPDALVDTVPLVGFRNTRNLTAKDVADFQVFMDFAKTTGTLSEKVDVAKSIAKF
jgi:NitT/TauT family transport system substrate-binding protein